MDAIVPAAGCGTCALLAAQVEILKEQVAQLRRRQVAELQARLDQNSSNSH